MDFSKVISMIEEMVTLLNAEQGDDCNKKAYCSETEDDAKALTISTEGYKDDTQEFKDQLSNTKGQDRGGAEVHWCA